MKAFHRLHALRMENDAAGYAMAEMRPRFQRMSGRHENGTAPRALSAYQLFQTPPLIAAQLAEMLELKPGERILEPSAGLGRLLDACGSTAREIVAVEIAPQLCKELFEQDRQGVQILQRDFLTVNPDETGKFDVVIMNPPFHMRSDIQHIKHALGFLKPGGRLGAIVLNVPNRKAVFGHLAQKWIDLPDRSFRETGTEVATAIIKLNRKELAMR
jgi:predicted RNA methylase